MNPSEPLVPAEIIQQRPDWAALVFFFYDVGFERGLEIRHAISDEAARFLGKYLWRLVTRQTELPKWEFEELVNSVFVCPRLPLKFTYLRVYTLLALTLGYQGYMDAKVELIQRGRLVPKLPRGHAALLHFSA